jgi:outer membrane protein OmpA-like peptidoglycan-associated protein
LTPSPTVAWAQGCLAQLLGSEVPQDGIMGPDTRQAVMQFQMQQQLPPTGMLDDNTVQALQAACSGQQAAPDSGRMVSAPPPAPPQPPPAQQSTAQQPTARRHGGNPQPEIDETEAEYPPRGEPAQKPSTLVLWFEWNSSKLRQDAEADSVIHLAMVIKEALRHLRATGGTIVLHGYSSREGAEEHNRDLARQRAERIKDLLVDAGIPEGRIEVVGHGANSDWPSLKWNRRVEVESRP